MAFTNSSALANSDPDNPKAAKHLPKADVEAFSKALVPFEKTAVASDYPASCWVPTTSCIS